MGRASILMILVLCGALAGCGMALQVTHQPQKEGAPLPLDGIPFYTKAVTCKHETVWFEQTYKLRVVASSEEKVGTKTEEKKPVFSGSVEITQECYFSSAFKKLRDAIEGKKTVSQINKVFDDLRNEDRCLYFPPMINSVSAFSFSTPRFILASNQNEPVVFVDYTDTHYINAQRPFSGSVNPDITLNSDLTLSKQSVNVQEETLKNVLSVLPFKEALAAVVPGAAAAAGERAAKVPQVTIELTVEPQVYKYTLSTLEKRTKTLPCDEPVDIISEAGGKNKVTFSRSMITADEGKKKEDEGNTIKVSGSVELPKPQPQAQGTATPEAQPKGGDR
jgi:hypothetical protein